MLKSAEPVVFAQAGRPTLPVSAVVVITLDPITSPEPTLVVQMVSIGLIAKSVLPPTGVGSVIDDVV
jgi:hypothetical protein